MQLRDIDEETTASDDEVRQLTDEHDPNKTQQTFLDDPPSKPAIIAWPDSRKIRDQSYHQTASSATIQAAGCPAIPTSPLRLPLRLRLSPYQLRSSCTHLLKALGTLVATPLCLPASDAMAGFWKREMEASRDFLESRHAFRPYDKSRAVAGIAVYAAANLLWARDW